MILLRRLAPILAIALLACPSDDDGGNETSGVSAPADDGMATTVAADDDGMATMPPADSSAGDDGGGNQAAWGAPCATDDDCVALLGEGGQCLFLAVIYELPGGYCSKECALPDASATVAPDAADCDPNGGVDCIGNSAIFQQCAVPCTDNSQCTREGYICRTMPMISQPDDPMYCLMQDCCEDDCADC